MRIIASSARCWRSWRSRVAPAGPSTAADASTTRMQAIARTSSFRSAPTTIRKRCSSSHSPVAARVRTLSYGVLEELRRTEIVIHGQRRRLIDEVDLITGVSGGAVPARSPMRCTASGCSPSTSSASSSATCRATSSAAPSTRSTGGSTSAARAGRSELAAEYYDEILFEGATFGDLLARQGPVAVANGTDISTGYRILVLPERLRPAVLGPHKVRLSRAAATSSAVPVVLRR